MKKVHGRLVVNYFIDVDENLKMEAVQRRVEAEVLKCVDAYGIIVEITDSDVDEDEYGDMA